jgi:hypothetical protein
MRREEDESAWWTLLVVLAVVAVAAFMAFVVIVVSQEQEQTCAELRRLYGPGRCVFARGDDPKLIDREGFARYLPQHVEAEP